jgi:penicillin-binding protein 1C
LPNGGARILRRGFVAGPLLILLAWLLLATIPHPSLSAFLSGPYSPVIVDRHGDLIQTLPLGDGLMREFAVLPEMPVSVVNVFQMSEDERFFGHAGVDPTGVIRAAVQNSRAGDIVSGGSTISMQLARMVRPHSGGITGKMREVAGAVRLEARLPKSAILELWLNRLPFGFQVEGVTSAARAFFGVAADQLSTEQVLLLAVIPRRPAQFNPVTQPEAAAEAAIRLSERIGVKADPNRIRSAALRAGADARAADASPVQSRPEAPHFVRFVAGQVADARLTGGVPVQTTLDLAVQHALEASIRARVIASSRFRIGNGAGIVVDNRTAGILAYVGSADFADSENAGQIDGIRILRQPGSTLKPFLYALALENGFNAASILPDIPAEFGAREIYVPVNFNRRYNGPVRLRTALASSLNVPAVYMVERLGVSAFASYLISLGFTSLERQSDSVGTGIALGNAEVSLMELARAFSVFARDGVLMPLSWELDPPAPAPDNHVVMRQSTAGIIRSILSDDLARVPGFGSRSVLDAGFEAIIKTGTSNQFNNIWAVGSSADITVAVWMGNFGGETVIGAPGSSLPAAVVIETLALFTDPGAGLPEPADVHRIDICATSGLRSTQNCPAVLSELFSAGTRPEFCNWHTSPHAPVRYPPEFQSWAHERDYLRQGSAPDMTGSIEIVRPANGAVFYFDPTVPATSQAVRVEVIGGAGEIQLYLNDAFLAQGVSPLVNLVPIRKGTLRFEAFAADPDSGPAARSTITVR